jgi:hypothetical protein
MCKYKRNESQSKYLKLYPIKPEKGHSLPQPVLNTVTLANLSSQFLSP